MERLSTIAHTQRWKQNEFIASRDQDTENSIGQRTGKQKERPSRLPYLDVDESCSCSEEEEAEVAGAPSHRRPLGIIEIVLQPHTTSTVFFWAQEKQWKNYSKTTANTRGQIRSDPKTDSQIASIVARVLIFARKEAKGGEAKVRGRHTWCARARRRQRTRARRGDEDLGSWD